MIKNSILFLFLLAGIGSFAQKTLSDYSYVVVPEQFEFLEGKDKYKTSSLTEFLFNKYGFHAYLASEAPNAKRCDGLYADIKENNSFFRTKLTVELKDCRDKIVYTGEEGVSKFKEYRKAYQDALRKAFNSIERLGVQQKDVVLTEAETETEIETEAEVKPATTPKNQSTAKSANIENLPDAKFLNYKKEDTSYLLRKTDNGYFLYEESADAKNGLILAGTVTVTTSEVQFTDDQGKTYDVYFDENQNFSVFKGETVMVYRLVR
ncbi:hypothetical protein [Marixanthomonas spongiae]|uniref:Uncharacterized protein n=1 Tax=Marixanthomonas spongiae TaxID=2174845 RepID=A0A2U0HWV5_9FLAO|nr:hypothetical protein [Marixanthomonas spongiae]PVW13344.1 hypothetical protein DDV96_13335 [Marixanthomonas spongiae]